MFKAESISKSYGKNQVLREVSISVDKGQCAGLLGINGSGKSTLLGILAGNLKADSGTYGFDGEGAARRVSLLPQENPLLPELSALDNIRLWHGGSRKSITERYSAIIGSLGVDAFLDKKVSKLSGGMKKRLSLSITLMSEPDLLLLDEPLAALDLLCRRGILDCLQDYKSGGGSIIVATHETSVLDICDCIYTLKGGRLSAVTESPERGFAGVNPSEFYEKLL